MWKRPETLPTHLYTRLEIHAYICTKGFLGSSGGTESACNAGNPSLIPRLGRSPGEGNGYPLQYSGLENSTDCIVYGVAKSQTQVSDFRFCSKRLFSLPPPSPPPE